MRPCIARTCPSSEHQKARGTSSYQTRIEWRLSAALACIALRSITQAGWQRKWCNCLSKSSISYSSLPPALAMTALCWDQWDAEVRMLCCACCCLLVLKMQVLAAAWQNPPAEVAAVFARVLQKDCWGLQQVVVACLSTGNQDMEKSPYLSKNSNYQFFCEALIPKTHPVTDSEQAEEDSKAEATISALQAM